MKIHGYRNKDSFNYINKEKGGKWRRKNLKETELKMECFDRRGN